MALTGDGSASYVRTQSGISPLTSAMTFHMIYRNAAAPGTGSTTVPFSLSDGTSAYQFGFFWDHATTNKSVFLKESGGTVRTAQLTSALSSDTDYYIGGTYDGVNIEAWLNGTSEASTAAAAPSAAVNPSPCALANDAGTADFDDGTIAEIGLWNTNLSSAELAMLGQGISPLLVRPGALVTYWQLIRDIIPTWGPVIESAGTLTVAVHPRVQYAAGPSVMHFSESTAALHQPVSISIAQTGEMSQTMTPLKTNLPFTVAQKMLGKSRFRLNIGYLATGRHKELPGGY